jgi:hypothetical protein
VYKRVDERRQEDIDLAIPTLPLAGPQAHDPPLRRELHPDAEAPPLAVEQGTGEERPAGCQRAGPAGTAHDTPGDAEDPGINRDSRS